MNSISDYVRSMGHRVAKTGPVKILNAFSINMLPEKLEEGKKHTVTFEPITIKGAKEIVDVAMTESFIGHEDTAAVLSDLLGIDVPMHRGFAKLDIGETALVAQFGGRLPEGTKTLPKDAKLKFFLVSVK